MTRAFLAACVAVVCGVAALCPEARAEATLEMYERPRAVVGNGRTYLFAARKDAPQSLRAYALDKEGGAGSRWSNSAASTAAWPPSATASISSLRNLSSS